ncbi:MAG: hypothetical protein KGI05_01860, partial [Thaumarchaeota archaeon]|nr:hypothetical protein [Nitrososphaerota archaeon]
MGLFGRAKKEHASDDTKQDEMASSPREEHTSPEITDLKKEIENSAMMLESYTHELEKAKTLLDAV